MMKGAAFNSLFKPISAAKDTKLDASARNARDIIAGEAALRSANTERLRAARLAHEADLAARPGTEPVAKPAARKKAARAI
jgi:hypothetical protein